MRNLVHYDVFLDLDWADIAFLNPQLHNNMQIMEITEWIKT